jgi:chromosome segregation ATPase
MALIQEALEVLRPLARQAKATVKLADVLESLVSLENYEQELRKTVNDLNAKAEKVARNIVDVEQKSLSRVRAHEAQAAEASQAGAKQAAAIVAAAAKDAEAILCAAEADKDVVEKEAAKALETVTRLRDEVAGLAAQRDQLAAQIQDFRDRISQLA